MYKKIRYGTFETNSSSVHTIGIPCTNPGTAIEKGKIRLDKEGFATARLGEYGWGPDVLDTQQKKLDYIITLAAVDCRNTLEASIEEFKKSRDFQRIERTLMEHMPECKGLKVKQNSFYINHQSVTTLSRFLEEDFLCPVSGDQEYIEVFNPGITIKELLFNPELAILIWNDNSSFSCLTRSRFFRNSLTGAGIKDTSKTVLTRYINGNCILTLFSDGTRIIEGNTQENFVPEFPTSIDLKITDRCDKGCKFCHESSTKRRGKHGDLKESYLETFHPGQEVAIGGGNVFEHPGLETFLMRLKESKVFPSITVHQDHFLENFEYIVYLKRKGLIYGIGVSVTRPEDMLLEKISSLEGTVCHVVSGIFDRKTYERMKGKKLKLLILGYKKKGRGIHYSEKNIEKIERNKQWLKSMLPVMYEDFEIVSFDCLASEQLDIKNMVPEEKYTMFYQGDDGTSTFYIDTVRKEFSVSSSSDKREKISEESTIKEMFDRIRRKG